MKKTLYCCALFFISTNSYSGGFHLKNIQNIVSESVLFAEETIKNKNHLDIDNAYKRLSLAKEYAKSINKSNPDESRKLHKLINHEKIKLLELKSKKLSAKERKSTTRQIKFLKRNQ